MIDINELRKLAQAALVAPDGLSAEWMDRLGQFQEAADPSVVSEFLDRLKAAELELDALRAENERMDEAMESLLIRCDDSDSAMYGTLSTSFVRDTVRIARAALEKSK